MQYGSQPQRTQYTARYGRIPTFNFIGNAIYRIVFHRCTICKNLIIQNIFHRISRIRRQNNHFRIPCQQLFIGDFCPVSICQFFCHIFTAAIAKEIGIFTDGDMAITGAELDAMTDKELDERVEHISVYARVSPENKIRIVKAWQRRGQVVSMTGDGVNDAPALKAADIGCAMGITGTDVAKGASDMTLTDDNFATIVDAVKEGRGIYANLKKVIGFLLGTNISEIIAVFFSMMVWHVTPFLSMHLLWINLVGDSLPAVALGMEPIEKDIMDRKPKPKSEGIFANGLAVRIVLQGLMFSVLSVLAFYLGWKVCPPAGVDPLSAGRTMAFMVLALSQAVHTYNMRTDHSVFKIGVFGNKYVNLATLAAVALMSLVLFTPLRVLFGLELLSVQLYLIALGLIIAPLVIVELCKLFGLIKAK